MKNPAIQYNENENSFLNVRDAKNKVNNVGFFAAVLTSLAIAALASGCTQLSDKTVAASFVSAGSGYPTVPIEKRVVPARKSKRVLPATLTSSSYLGRAPYICTPSGFGRTSGCFLRKG
jgi:hypothetical protein